MLSGLNIMAGESNPATNQGISQQASQDSGSLNKIPSPKAPKYEVKYQHELKHAA